MYVKSSIRVIESGIRYLDAHYSTVLSWKWKNFTRDSHATPRPQGCLARSWGPRRVTGAPRARENATARAPGGRRVIFVLPCFRITCGRVPYFPACIGIREHLCAAGNTCLIVEHRGRVGGRVCACVRAASMRRARRVQAPAPWIIQWDDLPILGKRNRPMVSSRVVLPRLNCFFC